MGRLEEDLFEGHPFDGADPNEVDQALREASDERGRGLFDGEDGTPLDFPENDLAATAETQAGLTTRQRVGHLAVMYVTLAAGAQGARELVQHYAGSPAIDIIGAGVVGPGVALGLMKLGWDRRRSGRY